MSYPDFDYYQSYIPLVQLSKGTELVIHSQTNSLAVKKQITAEQYPVYIHLYANPHRNFPRVLAVLEDGGLLYAYEEYISGETLEAKLQRSVLPEQDVIEYGLQLCDVLSFIHGANIIHRDINPSNVVVSNDNVVKLIDFGISRTVKENMPQDTTILGTVGYAAPEQFGFNQSDVRTDIYAFGVLMHILLTGHLPSGVPLHTKLGRVIQKCLRMDPSDRFQSATEVYKKLLPLRTMDRRIQYSHIPGFRTNVLWKKIVAVAGYVFLLILLASTLTEYDLTLWKTIMIDLFIAVIPFICISNPGYMFARIPGIRKTNVSVQRFIRIMIIVVSLVIAGQLGHVWITLGK